MKIAIAGAGNVGSYIAADLRAAGHDILLIEQEFDLGTRTQEEHPEVEVFIGDACEVNVLRDAGVGSADVMVAATGDDEDNLVVSLLADISHAAKMTKPMTIPIVRRRRPAVIIEMKSRQARRISCRANQARVPGWLMPPRSPPR